MSTRRSIPWMDPECNPTGKPIEPLSQEDFEYQQCLKDKTRANQLKTLVYFGLAAGAVFALRRLG